MLKGDLPNDMILQVFIEQLAEKVASRKAELRTTIDRAKQLEKFEKDMTENVRKVRGDVIEPEMLKKVY